MEATTAILESSYLIFCKNQAYQDCSQPIKGTQLNMKLMKSLLCFIFTEKEKKCILNWILFN